MRIRFRILLLVIVMQLRNHWSATTDLQTLQGCMPDPPKVPELNFDFNADPDHAFHSNTDADLKGIRIPNPRI